MVGFGSSLRMSRRCSWEDRYLDYQSLRLLLTQIKAVYEEANNNNNNIDGGGGGSGGTVDLFYDLNNNFEGGGKGGE